MHFLRNKINCHLKVVVTVHRVVTVQSYAHAYEQDFVALVAQVL